MNQQDKAAPTAPPVAAAAASIDSDKFWGLVAECGGTKDLGKNARTLLAHIDAFVVQRYESGFCTGYVKGSAEAAEGLEAAITRYEAAEASLARLVAGVEEVMRPYGIYDTAVFHGHGLQADFIATGNKLRALLPAKAEANNTDSN